MSAELRSGLHSDTFIYAEAVLQYNNLRRIIARRLVNKYHSSDKISSIDRTSLNCVSGIPNGATLLGEDVAEILKVRNIKLGKQDGKIKIRPSLFLKNSDALLLVEDICTTGSGVIETGTVVMTASGSGRVLPVVLIVVNRGGVSQIKISNEINLERIYLYSDDSSKEWNEGNCELCRRDSEPIKPKETDGNWQRIKTSQL